MTLFFPKVFLDHFCATNPLEHLKLSSFQWSFERVDCHQNSENSSAYNCYRKLSPYISLYPDPLRYLFKSDMGEPDNLQRLQTYTWSKAKVPFSKAHFPAIQLGHYEISSCL